jgi:hypothetical protein
LDHLSLLQRVTVEVATTASPVTYTRLTEPTEDQAYAFWLVTGSKAPPQTLG